MKRVLPLTVLLPVLLPMLLTACTHGTFRAPASSEGSATAVCQEARVPGLSAAIAAQTRYEALLPKGSAALEAAIFTPGRREAVAKLFTAAREQHLSFLEATARLHPNSLFPAMIERVKAAEPLIAAGPSPGAPAEFGARLLAREAGSSADRVLIPGVALLIDEAPDALRLMLLHELSHTIDPRMYAVPLEESGPSPWGNAVQCLRSPVSIAARAGGAECVEEKRNRLPLPKQKAFCAAEAAGLLANPDFSESGPFCGCPVPQGSEAFADWLAAEAMAAAASPEELQRALAWPCSAILREGARDAALDPRVLNQMRAADMHPLMPDRLEKIFLVQPKFREAIGATGEPAAAFYCPVSE